MTDDMRAVIVPKSDQLNADDLIAGPITVTVTGVKINATAEQPCAVSFEGDNGKPYKPCKSMARVMVFAWGADAKEYVGRSMTLYRDPDVTWAGMKVGGIRISHMSHIERDQQMMLTATKQSRKPFTVRAFAEKVDKLMTALKPQLEQPQEPEATQPRSFDDDLQEAAKREWTDAEVKKRGAEIAATLRDHGGDMKDLEASWRLVADEVMTMPSGAQKGLRKVYDEQSKEIAGGDQDAGRVEDERTGELEV